MTFEEVQPKKSVSTIPEVKGERLEFSKENSFEDNFPGLAPNLQGVSKATMAAAMSKTREKLFFYGFYNAKDIQEHCRDNQRIEEAIEAMVHGVVASDQILIVCQNYLYEVLGLEK